MYSVQGTVVVQQQQRQMIISGAPKLIDFLYMRQHAGYTGNEVRQHADFRFVAPEVIEGREGRPSGRGLRRALIVQFVAVLGR